MTRPSASSASAGLSVWNGSLPGARALSELGSSEKLAPRFCISTPVAGSTQPEPNSQYSDWMYDTASPLASAAPIQMVSPPLPDGGHFAALRRSIFTISASRNFPSRNDDGGAG